MNKFRIIIVALFSITCFVAFAQPANDGCSGAIDLGTLPTPNDCGGGGTEGEGAIVSFNGLTNVNATADNPYTYIADCQGSGTDMANPAQDVWYTITATGNSVNININNLSGFSNPSIGFWEGSCSGLTARGCANGTGSTVFEPTTPGQTYYIQISGNGASSEGTFDLDISNSNDCSQCVLGSSLTASPLPVNGTYTAATEVTFCYTISEFEKVNTNWVHGVTIEDLGSGWDAAFGTGGITVSSTPGSCQGNYGDWVYYDSPSGCLGNGNPGWYYILPTSANPCQNFGDPGVAEPGGGGCTLEFCFTLRTDPLTSCNPASPNSLGFSINTSADGETGSWGSTACGNDPVYGFSAIQACCIPPTAVIDNQILCYGDSNGIATVTAGSASDPFNYQWYGSGGDINFETTASTLTTNTESTLFEDTYTIIVTDNNGCQAATDLIMTTTPGASITSDIDDTLCSNISKTINTFVAGPAGATFTWSATTDIGFGTTGTNQIGAFTAINSSGSIITSEVTVIPTAAGCAGIPEIFSLTINPSPVVAAVYAIDCGSGDINSSFTPAPTSFDVAFTNDLVRISANAGGAMGIGSGTSSLPISGITPSTLEANQITSACFSLRHACYGDIDYFTLSVDGTTYTSTSGSPAGATFNSDLATMLTGINGGTSDVIYEACFPSSFLSLFDGATTNTNWDLTFNDPVENSCGAGGGTGDMVEFEVIIQNTPEYDFSWSGGSLLGTTSGTSTIDTLPTVFASSDGTYILQVTDKEGCAGFDTAIFNCALSLQDLNFNVQLINGVNQLNWSVANFIDIGHFTIERKNQSKSWEELGLIKSTENNFYTYEDKTYDLGNNFYRIKLNFNNGDVNYSRILDVSNELNKDKKIIGIYDLLGKKTILDNNGVKFIMYDDGSVNRVIEY